MQELQQQHRSHAYQGLLVSSQAQYVTGLSSSQTLGVLLGTAQVQVQCTTLGTGGRAAQQI